MTGNKVEILNPIGEIEVGQLRPKGLKSFAGTTVGLVDAHKVNSDVLLRRLGQLLREKHGVRDAVYGDKPNAGRGTPKAVLDDMAQRADFGIVAFGD